LRYTISSPGEQGASLTRAADLLVHQYEYVFPLLLQQLAVEFPSAAASRWRSQQEFPEPFDHCCHLLSELAGPQLGRGN
jgi:hypothetical protein